jgi:hydroxyacid-oxoacid transhydrogenase
MSYGVTHLMHDIVTEGYPVTTPFIPHGISVIVTAPAIFKYTAAATPERHMQGAEFLSADAKGATLDDAGEVLANRLIELMKATNMPNGLTAIGFDEQHVSALAASSVRQGKAIANAPRESNQVDLENMYRNALSHW